jgi:hypothetical protein
MLHKRTIPATLAGKGAPRERTTTAMPPAKRDRGKRPARHKPGDREIAEGPDAQDSKRKRAEAGV